MTILSYAKLSLSFELEKLCAALSRIHAEAWLDHVNKRNYLGVWQALPLRCQAEYLDAHPIMQGFAIEAVQQGEWCDLPILDSLPEFKAVLDSLKCPLRSVRLMRLNAGASISPHRDHGVGLEWGEARLHLPIETHPELKFIVNGVEIPMAAGELWYINADQLHSVTNESQYDRINLVVDCMANEWLKNMIKVKAELTGS